MASCSGASFFFFFNKDVLVYCNEEVSIDTLIELTICLDNLLHDHNPKNLSCSIPPHSPEALKPMQLGNTRLTPTE